MDAAGERVASLVTSRPGTVILVFLVLTAVFALGLPKVTRDVGTASTAESVPEYDAYQKATDRFEDPFDPDDETTQLVQTGNEVLSRDALLAMLRAMDRLESRERFHVSGTTSAAGAVARELDPSARTLEEQRLAVADASSSEVRRAVRARASAIAGLMGDDFNPQEGTATATIGAVRHDLEDASSDIGAGGGDASINGVQLRARRIVGSVDGGGEIRVFGQGILNAEFSRVLQDSLKSAIPLVVVLLLLFLAVAFRDPFDVAIGAVSLAMALVWTFGYMGHAGIPFSQLTVTLPPFLIAIGVDFGVHVVDHYREMLAEEGVGYREAMEHAVGDLSVTFSLVALTTMIGFSANLTSDISKIYDYGAAAAGGIVFLALVFSVFLPALKVWVEERRRRYELPSFDTTPIAAEGSRLGAALTAPYHVTRRAPMAFLVLVLLTTAVAGYYGQNVDTTFEEEDMLPAEDVPAHVAALPAPLAPSEYSSTELTTLIDERFETTGEDTVTVYAEGPMTADHALETLQHANADPPSTFVSRDGAAVSNDVLGVIRDHAAASPEFRRLVAENDRDADGVPDADLERIYDELLASPYGDEAQRYLSDDYRSSRLIYRVESDASREAVIGDAEELSERFRFDTEPTGGEVVFQAVTVAIFDSAVSSIMTALALSMLFLFVVYRLGRGKGWLVFAVLLPILVTVVLVVSTMWYLGLAFNTLTATVLSITVGIGVDYTIHLVQRFDAEFADAEIDEALTTTLRGTGGALFGSMVTDVAGTFTLFAFSLTPILIQFGLIMSISVVYAFVVAILLVPAVLLIGYSVDSRSGGLSGLASRVRLPR